MASARRAIQVDAVAEQEGEAEQHNHAFSMDRIQDSKFAKSEQHKRVLFMGRTSSDACDV